MALEVVTNKWPKRFLTVVALAIYGLGAFGIGVWQERQSGAYEIAQLGEPEPPTESPPPSIDDILFNFYYKCELNIVYHRAIGNEKFEKAWAEVQTIIKQIKEDKLEPQPLLLDSLYMQMWAIERDEPAPKLLDLRHAQEKIDTYIHKQWNEIK